ncbi:MAG: ROK family protein [Planctomycetes bacterium]|nr:ROK family protein [Planctomycetota bacterium]
MATLGIDIGGTKIFGVIVDDETIRNESRSALPQKEYGAFIEECAGFIRGYLSKEKIDAVGVCIAGALDPVAGVVFNSPNIAFIDNRNFAGDLSAKVGVKVLLENDANAFVYAECVLGAGRWKECVIGLTIGTGVGGGIVIGGKVHRGADFVGAELGHMIVDQGGVLCGCGRKGCVEALISGTAILNHVPKYFSPARASEIGSAEEVFDLLNAGDESATMLFSDYARWFAISMANYIAIFNPDVIVLGGGISRQPFIFKSCVPLVKDHLFTDAARVIIEPAVLGPEAGAVGAALLAKQAKF